MAMIWIPYNLYSPSFKTKYVKIPNLVRALWIFIFWKTNIMAVIWIPYNLYSPSFRTKYVKMPNMVERPLDFHILKN